VLLRELLVATKVVKSGHESVANVVGYKLQHLSTLVWWFNVDHS